MGGVDLRHFQTRTSLDTITKKPSEAQNVPLFFPGWPFALRCCIFHAENQAKTAYELSVSRWALAMAQHSGKALSNESEYPNIVELAVGSDGLGVGLSRKIIDFHKVRYIEPRHGRISVREGKIYFRWCFSDLATARAFIEQFGGEICEGSKDENC